MMEYLIKSTAILTIFYIFYKIFLQNETFFKPIRSYFLIGIISALVIPYIVINKYVQVSPVNLPSDLNFTNISTTAQLDSVNWFQLMITVYFLGVIFFTIRFMAQLSSLIWFLYTHQKIKSNKYTLVETTKKIAPFSFFNYIVYNVNDFDSKELRQILTHEKIHADQFHSIDIILAQCVAIVNWFNPFIWLYHKEMQKNLEYTADEFAQNIANEKKKYQYLLLKTISPNYKMALTSNFYNSLIKKRINMLHKDRSNRNRQIKFALIIPVLVAFVFIFNTKVIAQNNTVKKQKIVNIDNKIIEFIITKDNTDADLEKIKSDFLKENVTVKFKGINRNSNGEIIAIKIDVSTKTSNANYNTNSDQPIKPIKISFDSDGNSISIGNANGYHNGDFVFISEDGHKATGNNTYFISKKDDGNIEKHVVKINSNDGHVWASSDGDSTKIHTIKIVGTKGGHGENVWVTEGGDSTKIKIIEIHEDHDGDIEKEKTVWVTKKGDKTEEIIIKKSGHSDSNTNIMFIESDGEKPLFIINGEESNDSSIEDIDPDSIETIDVLKGDKAVEKYGEKGKNGVILIKTKK